MTTTQLDALCRLVDAIDEFSDWETNRERLESAYADARAVIAAAEASVAGKPREAQAPTGHVSIDFTAEESLLIYGAIDHEEGSAITLHVGAGHSGDGVYLSWTEYPDEGAILVSKIPAIKNTQTFQVTPSECLASLSASRPAADPPQPAVKVSPENCRQRLMREGKLYPRSSCAVCGRFSPRWKECDAMLNAARVEGAGEGR